jgi:hypothetical protein
MNYLQSLLQILNRNIPTSSLEEFVSEFKIEDWDQILIEASKQGLKPVLLDSFENQGILQFVPDVMVKSLKDFNLSIAGRNMRILHHAGIILSALQNQKIEVIVLKGLYLIESVYKSIGMRNFGDLDLLIRREDLKAALTVMRGMGFQLSTWYDAEASNKDIKHIPPMIKPNAPLVELHWSILEEAAPFAIDIKGLWKRSIPARIAGTEVRSLSYEDLILHLCIHQTYQHQLKGGLRNLVDIAQILETVNDQIDWIKLISIAKTWGVERVIVITFTLLDDILGVEIPKFVFDQLASDTFDIKILSYAKSQILSHGDATFSMTPDLAAFSATEGLIPKIKLVLSRIFLPRHVMARLFNVPPQSPRIYLYYCVRFKELYLLYSCSARRLLKKDPSLISGAENEQMRESLVIWMENR